MQLDVGTCVEVGGDPVAWIKSNPGRIHVMHCKEWGKAKGYASVFGEGDSPWKDIFAAAESVGGIEYYLIEQEQYPPGLNDMATSALDIANWRKMRPEYKQPLDWKTLDPS
jgi:sugar phosphate isomerase/epimerase